MDPAIKAHEALHTGSVPEPDREYPDDRKARDEASPKRSTTGRQNEILCDDIKGKQVLHLRAAKDMYLHAVGSRFDRTAGGDHVRCLQKNEVSRVQGVCYRICKGGANEHIGDDFYRIARQNIEQISQQLFLTSGKRNVLVGKANLWLISDRNITLQCGKSLISIRPDSITITAPLVQINPPSGESLAAKCQALWASFKAVIGKIIAQKADEFEAALKSNKEQLARVDRLSPAKKTAKALADEL